MNITGINSANYPQRTHFKANVHSVVDLPCKCKNLCNEASRALREKIVQESLAKGCVKETNIDGILVSTPVDIVDMVQRLDVKNSLIPKNTEPAILGKKVDLLLLDKKASEPEKLSQPSIAENYINKLKKASDTIQLFLDVKKEDFCPFCKSNLDILNL